MKKIIILGSVIGGMILAANVLGYARGIVVLDGTNNGMRVLPIGQDGNALFIDVSTPSGFAWKDPTLLVNPVELNLVPGVTNWTNQPASTTELNIGWREQYNLTNADKARIVVTVTATGTGVLGVQYFNGVWTWLDGQQDIVSQTSTVAQSNSIPLTSKGVQNTPWFFLPADGQNDALLRVVGSGGDGVADPQFVNLRLQIR